MTRKVLLKQTHRVEILLIRQRTFATSTIVFAPKGQNSIAQPKRSAGLGNRGSTTTLQGPTGRNSGPDSALSASYGPLGLEECLWGFGTQGRAAACPGLSSSAPVGRNPRRF